MKRYDVFKSQGGYGIALGIYLDSPVVGTIRWFETKEEADGYVVNKKRYEEAYAQWEKDIEYMSFEEIEKTKPPKEKDYNINNVGVII
jgi:hypothetical protein